MTEKFNNLDQKEKNSKAKYWNVQKIKRTGKLFWTEHFFTPKAAASLQIWAHWAA
jgi:hypothetical protein